MTHEKMPHSPDREFGLGLAFIKTLTMTSRLQLHLSAKDLKNLSGLMGKSDPFAVVTLRGDAPNNNPSIIGQTDV
jgi:hypothetical protein